MTRIEWADETWNPITGCSEISAGCAHCYARRMSWRLAGRFGYPAEEPWRVTVHPERFNEPYQWRKPRRVFVCSMGDLFHEDVPWEARFAVFQIMGMLSRHRFLVLTKRPGVMLEQLGRRPCGWGDLALHLQRQDWCRQWPLRNVALGVTVEREEYAFRARQLSEIPAAMRFVSVEPMLWRIFGWPVIEPGFPQWVICGAETGPGARPFDPDWAVDLMRQCREARVPFFFKRAGKGQAIPAELLGPDGTPIREVPAGW